ncbi:MAG: restriction endonuclease [Patescibacteria group bacterium]|nr:restriction endonuclease [Patescibacteria group bacterium]
MEELEIGKARAYYNTAGTRILKYQLEMVHKGLNEYKVISAPELYMLENKVQIQADKWNTKWQSLLEKQRIVEQKEANIEEATERTEEAINRLHQIDNLLLYTLDIDDTIDWDTLKRHDCFPEPKPAMQVKVEYPKKPTEDDEEYQPVYRFIDKLSKKRRLKKKKKLQEQFQVDLENWNKEKLTIDRKNLEIQKEYNNAITTWEKENEIFLKKKDEYNQGIELLKEKYRQNDPTATIEYCEMVLNNSQCPESFPRNFEFDYNPETKILIVEYSLPPIECFPTLKEVKYLVSKKELKETYISESELNKMFDSTMYKIALRTLHELFEADKSNALQAISFNGWINSINKATGIRENTCILSILAKKEEFMELDLANVDPKLCFKNLKGVGSSKLSGITPIKPILKIDKSDKRFVDAYTVVADLDETSNLAAMDWEDFEHLIRELFEKEFASGGGEVKVTQASRDGGVDAIAFDPDPIRGGKIVIQAKRYTNVVGVSAVRDLYGTVVNEGAIKGILVTTADYGPDAYDFAKSKPITLLNGSNLLHLLERHGHKCRIDLKEAKIILSEK